MRRYVHQTATTRTCFGQGIAATVLAEELRDLEVQRALVIADTATPEILAAIVEPITPHVAASLDGVRQHVPIEQVHHARELASAHRIDCIVTVGGGSATGLAKAVALTAHVPIAAEPTTYAGSEVTPIWGMTAAHRKTTGRDERVRPAVVIYDSDLFVTLPPEVAAASAINAMAHCFETLWVPHATPVAHMFALEGIRWLTRGLDSSDPTSPADHINALLHGTYFAGTAFALTGSGLHHKICHALGGAFNLPHAQTHAVLLPHVLRFNRPVLGHLERRVAQALDADDSIDGLARIYKHSEIPATLAELGLTTAQLPQAISTVRGLLPVDNLREVTTDAIAEIITSAYSPSFQER